jgi:rhamnosyltransferase
VSDPLVSIVLRSYNEGWALQETLPALRAQNYRSWELLVFDSGSTDGSVDLIRAFRPRHFVQFAPHDYISGRVLNEGLRLARSEFVLFLNADATPQGENWLRPLLDALLPPENAAVFGRQIPRPDCQAVFACDYERCFGPRRESDKWDHFFSMVSSGLRKDVWRRRGFLESIRYAEDDEYTRWCRARGFSIVYCPESVVMHSHNYTPAQAYRRSFGDAEAIAMSSNRQPSVNPFQTLLLGWLNDFRHDLGFCLRSGRMRELPHAARVRWCQRRGKLNGFATAIARRQEVSP